MAKQFKYFGDVSARHGGYFYNASEAHYDYADVVRIVPCSDAGGPDNLFWVETISVLLPSAGGEVSPANADTVLSCFGQTWTDIKDKSRAERLAILIDACLSYGRYDIQNSEIVRVGPVDEFFSDRSGDWAHTQPHKVLRANASLRNYARSRCA